MALVKCAKLANKALCECALRETEKKKDVRVCCS